MDQREEQARVEPNFRVLTSGTAGGHRVQVVEYGDGSVAVTFDGAVQAVYRPGSGNVESCVNTSLTLLRSDTTGS
jgi:hypothetical protein